MRPRRTLPCCTICLITWRHVDWHGKADPDIAACWREDSGVDAHQLTAQVDQRTAGVARIDGRVSLDEVLVPLLSQTGPAKGAHKTGGHRLPKAERIADREHEIPDFELIAIAHRNCFDGMGVLEA